MRSTNHYRNRRTARQLSLLIALPLLSLLALRIIWGWEANHRLAVMRSNLLAQGIRLNPPVLAVPDDQNAALAVIETVQAIRLNPEELPLIYGGDGSHSWITNVVWPDRINGGAYPDISWTDAHKPEVRRILAKNAGALGLMKIAAQRKSGHWPTTTSLVHFGEDHSIYHTRQLAILLCDAAAMAIEDHNIREALDDLHLILELARIVDRDPAEMSHVYASVFRALAAQTLEYHEARLRLSEADQSADTARQLLASLLDSQYTQDSRASAWEAQLGSMSVFPHTGLPKYWQWWFDPLFVDETARTLAIEALEVPSVRAENWQRSKFLFPKAVPLPDSFLIASTQFASSNAGTSWGVSRIHFQTQSDLAAASLLLAARLYELRHAQLPTKAELLMPDFLPHLPMDPYDADGRSMHYRLDSAGPTVWSVGENGTDEGAPIMFDPFDGSKVRRHGRSPDPARNPPDIVYGAAWRTAVPTTEPALSAPGKPRVPSPLPLALEHK